MSPRHDSCPNQDCKDADGRNYRLRSVGLKQRHFQSTAAEQADMAVRRIMS